MASKTLCNLGPKPERLWWAVRHKKPLGRFKTMLEALTVQLQNAVCCNIVFGLALKSQLMMASYMRISWRKPLKFDWSWGSGHDGTQKSQRCFYSIENPINHRKIILPGHTNARRYAQEKSELIRIKKPDPGSSKGCKGHNKIPLKLHYSRQGEDSQPILETLNPYQR